MVKFKIGSFEFDFYDSTKHHPLMPIHIGRTYQNGTYQDLIISEALRQGIEEVPEDVYEITRHVYQNNQLEPVTDKMVKARNAEYEQRDFDYYSVGAMNTKQNFTVRCHFLFEKAYAVLTYDFKSSGTFASGFHSELSNVVETAVEENIDKPFEVSGIRKGDERRRVHIFAVDMNEGFSDEIDVSIRELEEALIGVELLHFDMQITDDLGDDE